MKILSANWPASPNIHAFTTLRGSDPKAHGYDSFNLAAHVGDNPQRVEQNRAELMLMQALPMQPIWLNQTHSNRAVLVENEQVSRDADASLTRRANQVLAILTADCLPILICNHQGSEIAAIHAGWRGLASGIIEATLAQFKSSPHECMAWIGPAICGSCYATGPEVLTQFSESYPFAPQAFDQANQQLFLDLAKMAGLILNAQGIEQVYFSKACTYESNNQFYSYRREAQTGRIATLIWFEEPR